MLGTQEQKGSWAATARLPRSTIHVHHYCGEESEKSMCDVQIVGRRRGHLVPLLHEFFFTVIPSLLSVDAWKRMTSNGRIWTHA